MMHLKRWLWVLGLILLCQRTAGASDSKPCALKRITAVDIQFTHGGQVLVPITVNGTAARALLDTSHAFGIVTISAAKPLGLRIKGGGNQTITIGGSPLRQTTTITRLGIGNVQFADVNVALTDAGFQVTGPIEASTTVGVIGLDLFQHLDLELDFATHQLRLYSQDHCAGEVVYWTDNYETLPMLTNEWGNVYFPMELDGIKLATTLSTAEPVTTMIEDTAHRIYSFDHTSDNIERAEDDSTHQWSYFRAMALTTDNLKVINARVRLNEHRVGDCKLEFPRGLKAPAMYSNCLGLFPLQLGMNVLSKLHLYLATREKKLYFSLADATRNSPVNTSAPAAGP